MSAVVTAPADAVARSDRDRSRSAPAAARKSTGTTPRTASAGSAAVRHAAPADAATAAGHGLSVMLPVLAFWFATSTGFNDFTPRLMTKLIDAGGSNTDLTLIELAVTVLIAATRLMLQGQRVLPPRSKARDVALTGALHLGGCRLFVYSLSLGVPVSLAQTVRAMNPIFTVLLGLLSGQHYPPSLLLALAPIAVGFGMAVSADINVNPAGVLASVGSVQCLVLVNTRSKRVCDGKEERVDSSELQCWLCISALLWLIPSWAWGGGVQRLGGAFAVGGSSLLWFCALDGAFYFSEQIAQFAAIEMHTPLTLAVVDTVRRLFIVCVAGFVLQGNPYSALNVLGAALVCGGAAAYSVLKSGEGKHAKSE